MNKYNTQKGRIPLKKIKYMKQNEIGIYIKKGMEMKDKYVKSMEWLKKSLELGKKYNRYKREGIRLGRGKSKKDGINYKLYKDYKLFAYPISNNIKNITIYLKHYLNNKKKLEKLINISKRYPKIKITLFTKDKKYGI